MSVRSSSSRNSNSSTVTNPSPSKSACGVTNASLDVAGRHDAAQRAYQWLVDVQRTDGSWHAYYDYDGGVEDPKIDTNVCAYIATGLWHHWLSTGDREFVEATWPTVDRAIDFVLAQRRHDGLVLWAIEPDGTRPWDYALLTGTSSIQHALRCGSWLAAELGHDRSHWIDIADDMVRSIQDRPDAFEPKARWAMDWYYPVLTGALDHETAKRRMGDGWDTFTMEGLGIRCVSDEPWVTASETAECALAYAAMGDTATATDLLRWTRTHRNDDGSYWTGIVYPDEIVFPFDEVSSYTAAAVILAVDAISGTSPASRIFAACPSARPRRHAARGWRRPGSRRRRSPTANDRVRRRGYGARGGRNGPSGGGVEA